MVLNQFSTVRDRVRQSAVIREEHGLTGLTFHALGTRCRVLLVEPSRAAANACLDEILNWVAAFEAKYSRFLEGSLISRINAAAGQHWVETDEEADRILALCAEMVFLTRGAFDPTAMPLARLWNWKANPPAIPSDETIRSTRELVGWNKVQRRKGGIFLPQPGMGLDLGGIGKEYAVDYSGAIALQHGVENVLIDFGQDIRVFGKPTGRPAWHVGLENPAKPGSSWASVAVRDHAVASSGDYLRHFMHEGRRYGHIIDPRTGYPVETDCLSVNVVAPNCTFAGILSTAAFILGPKEGYHFINGFHGASGAFLTNHGNTITPRFYEHLVSPN